jgi:hypothetical protein
MNFELPDTRELHVSSMFDPDLPAAKPTLGPRRGR